MVSLELLFLWTSILLKTDSGPILQNQRFHKKNTQSRSLHFNRNTNSLLTVSEISCTTFHKIRMTNLCTYYRLLAPVPSFMQAWQIRPLKCPINPQPKYVYISLIIFHSLFSAHLYCHSSTILFRYELKCIPHFIPICHMIKNNSWALLNKPPLLVRFMWMTLREMLPPLLLLGRKSHSRRWFQSPHRVSWKMHMFI